MKKVILSIALSFSVIAILGVVANSAKINNSLGYSKSKNIELDKSKDMVILVKNGGPVQSSDEL